MVYWEGEALLDWGNGLQLTVPADLFEGKGSDVQLVLSYTQDYSDYDDIQMFYGDWSSMLPFNVGSSSFTGDFIPSNYYSTGTGTSHVTAFSFSEETLAIILQKGVVIQGHGIQLNKVQIASPSAISQLSADESTTTAPVYTIDGKRVMHTLPGHLYIQNRTKFIAR